jgi:hypothetical protein
MSRLPVLHDWPDGPVIPRGSRLQEQVEAIRALDSREGYSGSLPSDAILVETWWGKIVGKSDDGRQFRSGQTADDERYWVQRQFIQPAKSTYEDQLTLGADVRPILDLDKKGDPQLDFQKNLKTKIDPAIYSVVNMLEIALHSHTLVIDTVVRVEAFLDRDDPRRMRWVMFVPVSPFAQVSLTTTAGANSTTTATATYTYTFTDPWTGLTVTGATPTWGRPPGPLTGAATHGMVYRTGSTTSLLFTDEQAAVTTSCT